MRNVGLPFLLLLVLAAAGCAPRSIESYQTGENEEDIVRMLNERDYGKAVFLIESKNGKSPADKKVALLLAQAYLGKAGFEPLAVAARVAGEQNASSPEARTLFPRCSANRLDSVRGAEPLCLVKRVYLQVPDPDLEEMTRARDLLRYAYPDPSETPESLNVLIGVVETAACLKRAGNIYLFALRFKDKTFTPSDDELAWLVRQGNRALHEAAQALGRAQHAGNKISQLLTGSHDSVWFSPAAGAVNWADQVGLARLFDLLREALVAPADEARYGEALNKIRALLEKQTATIRGT